MSISTNCPHCEAVLDPPPKQSRKCPECRERIIVRTHPVSKAKFLLTEEGAAEFDDAKRTLAARNKVIRGLPVLGVGDGAYDREEQRLAEKFGKSPSPGDVYWSMANKAVQRLGRDPENNAHQIQQIYWQMGLHRLGEGAAKADVQMSQRESHRWQLTNRLFQFQEASLASRYKAEIRTDTCCTSCGALEGTLYDIEEAIEVLPLPQPECEEDWCTCWWSFRIAGPSRGGGPALLDEVVTHLGDIEEDDSPVVIEFGGVVLEGAKSELPGSESARVEDTQRPQAGPPIQTSSNTRSGAPSAHGNLPGWYPDPQRIRRHGKALRWWDGDKWTGL